MSKGVWAFRPAALTRAIKAAEKAGKTVAEAQIDSVTGKIMLKFGESGASLTESTNEWDEAA
jgi:hydroxymethylglutaryl-CoA reductase